MLAEMHLVVEEALTMLAEMHLVVEEALAVMVGVHRRSKVALAVLACRHRLVHTVLGSRVESLRVQSAGVRGIATSNVESHSLRVETPLWHLLLSVGVRMGIWVNMHLERIFRAHREGSFKFRHHFVERRFHVQPTRVIKCWSRRCERTLEVVFVHFHCGCSERHWCI